MDIFAEKKSFCMNWGVVCFLLTECWRVAICNERLRIIHSQGRELDPYERLIQSLLCSVVCNGKTSVLRSIGGMAVFAEIKRGDDVLNGFLRTVSSTSFAFFTSSYNPQSS